MTSSEEATPAVSKAGGVFASLNVCGGLRAGPHVCRHAAYNLSELCMDDVDAHLLLMEIPGNAGS